MSILGIETINCMREDKPRAHQISRMTNVHLPSAATNFNLFADAINFNLMFGGRFTAAPYGNHITELESLVYVLVFRIKDPNAQKRKDNKTIKYVKFLLSNSKYFQANDYFIETYHDEIVAEVEAIIKTSYSQLKGVLELKDDIEKILKKVKLDYLKKVVSHVYRNVQCRKHKPKFHYKYFKYFSQLLFAHYYYAGYTRNDIKYFMNQVLSSEVQTSEDGSKVYTSAPLPKELYMRLIKNNEGEKKDTEILKDVKGYLNNRTLDQQVEGLENIDYRERTPYRFVFRLENLHINKSPIAFENVELYSHEDFVEKFKHRIISGYDFFEQPKLYACSYVIVGCEEYSQDKAVKACLTLLDTTLSKFRLKHQSKFLINKLQHIVNFDMPEDMFAVNSVYNRYVFNDHEKALLNSPDHISKDTERQNFFNKLDDILGEAYTEENDHIAISSYWKFCDVITNYISLSFQKEDDENEKIEVKVQSIALILALIEKRSYKFYLRQWARNVASNSRLDEKEIIFRSKEFRKEIMEETVGFASLQKLYSSLSHIHTKGRIKDAIELNKKGNFKERYLYFTAIFIKVYSLRNAEKHFHNRFDNYARNLKLSLDEILRELRIELSLEAKKYANRNKSMRVVVQSLIEKAYTILYEETKPNRD